jgi:hypothetical protein
VTKDEIIEALAHYLSRARFGPGLDMGGKHNPQPSEYIKAREMFSLVENFVKNNGRLIDEDCKFCSGRGYISDPVTHPTNPLLDTWQSRPCGCK